MSKGYILIFDNQSKDLRIIGGKGAMVLTLGEKELKFGGCECLEVSEDGSYLVSGYTAGNIVFWDLSTLENVKNIIGVFKDSVKNILCLKSQGMNCLAYDSAGSIIRIDIVQKYFLTSVDKQILFQFAECKIASLTPSCPLQRRLDRGQF